MKKLSKILKESIWSDLQDRGSGAMVRKEDDINLLDDDGVLDYIKRNYTTKDFTYFPGVESYKDINNDITIPICERRGVLFCLTYIMGQYTKDPAFKSNENVILITSGVANYILSLYKELSNNYNLDRVERIDKFSTYIKIQPKDESVPVTNSFLIEVLDFILENENDPRDNKMKKINESIWSDLQDRGSGEVKRKEDDVDFITDRKVFRDYLKKHYKETDTTGVCEIEAGHYCDRVIVPVCWVPGVDSEIKYLSIEDFADDDRYMILTYNISKFPDIYKLLSDNYRLNILRDLSGKPDALDIEPKDKSKVTNKLFLDVLDLLLDNIVEPLKPLVEKKTGVNESIWSDLQDRSSGDVIRKEDAFNPEYVDFGENTTVVWAKEALEIDGEVRLSFNDVKDYNNNGWRLPTVEEVKQIDWTSNNVRIYWAEGYRNLIFPEGVLLIHTDSSGTGFHMWTKDRHEKWNNDVYTYGYDNSYKFDIDSTNISINKCYAFLVKDKKLLKR